MKPNCSAANRTSVRPTSSPRSPRSAAASRGSETLCRPSLPTAEASPAACAASAKWCANSTQCAPAAAMDGPAAVDATLASAASANASTGAAVQTPTHAAADDLGQRTFRCARPTFRNRRRSGEKTCGGRRCSRGHDDLGQRAFRYFRPAFRNRRRSGE